MLDYHTLFDSAIASVSNYACTAGRSGPAAEENCGGNRIVFMRYGVFCRHFGNEVVTSDVNQATFFPEGSSYRVSHPTDGGNHGTVLTLSSQILNEMIREFDPTIDDDPEQPFPFVTSPCDARTFNRYRELVMVLESGQLHSPDPLWVDEKAIQLFADVLKAAFERHGAPKKQIRPQTNAKHIDLAESARLHLASRIGIDVQLGEVARAVGASPFHLTRVFRRHTGMPVHRYLVCLRLRTSLERLAAGANDLTTLALELGFSSHSHFSDSFRREFGCSPSEMRDNLTKGSLREMSKNLEA